jgi:hypothetical protein
MGHFDPIAAAWQLRCPEQERLQAVALTSFRIIERFPGPSRPPAFKIQFDCPGCGGRHPALMTQRELDLAPVLDPSGAHFDLMLGRMDWRAEGIASDWQLSIRRGHWPIVITCAREHRTVGAWPSVLRVIEPGAEGYLVQYFCPACHHFGSEQWGEAELSLAPRI